MKLQIAMDVLEPEALIKLFKEIKDWVDIVELGTPYLLRHGANIIRRIKEISTNTEILCDAKVIDAGFYEAEELFKAGADYVTVLAVADNATLADAVQAAKKYNGKVVADMICVKDFPEKVKELEKAGVDYLAVHTGVDEQAQGRTPLDDLKELKNISSIKTAVAGGISSETLDDYLKENPDIIIIGGGILKAENPVTETQNLYNRIKNFKI